MTPAALREALAWHTEQAECHIRTINLLEELSATCPEQSLADMPTDPEPTVKPPSLSLAVRMVMARYGRATAEQVLLGIRAAKAFESLDPTHGQVQAELDALVARGRYSNDPLTGEYFRS